MAGRQEAGTEAAAVCAHALLALEPLIHPRCLPPAGTPAAVAAGMSAGRATSATLVPHMQRQASKPPTSIPAQPSPQLPTTTNNNNNNTQAAAANNGFAVPASVSTLKLGQLAMDPWAEVDTWLGYGEDFGGDDSLFYPETDGILVGDFANTAQSYGVSLLTSNCEATAATEAANRGENPSKDMSIHQTLDAASNPRTPLESSSGSPGNTRAVDTDSISMCVEIPVVKSDFAAANQADHVELCPSLAKFAVGISLPPSEVNTNAAYSTAVEDDDTFPYSNEPVDITTDTDSEDALQDVVDVDADPDSD